jgi:hypothetical protein
METILSFAVAVSSVLTSIIVKWSPSRERKNSSRPTTHPEYSPERYWFLEVLWTENSTSRREDLLFNYVREMLNECDCLPIAVSLIDVLTTFAVTGNVTYSTEVVASSCLALTTIYAEVEQSASPTAPFIVAYMLNRILSGCAHRKMLFEKSIGRLCLQCRENRPGFSLYRVLIIQHFCTLALSGDLVAQNVDFIASLVQELDDRYLKPLDQKHGVDEKKDPEFEYKAANRGSKALPFLSVDFFEHFYEYLMFALVGVIAICPPCTVTISGVSFGPYVHIHALLQLLRRLLSLYKEHFVAFSRKSASFIYEGSQLALAASWSKVQECVTWRNNQPFPQPGCNTAETAYDRGSTEFLKRLLDIVTAVAASVCDVCEVWQNQTEDLSLKSKSTRLQQVADNTMKSLNRVATMHNWPPPETHVTVSFDEVVSVQGGPYTDSRETGADTLNEVGYDDLASDDESFCATGNWG